MPWFRTAAVILAPNAPLRAMAEVTGVTGSGVPFDNRQSSLAAMEVMLSGPDAIFPPFGRGGSASGNTLGFVYAFADTATPGTSMPAQGQTLQITQNPALFTLIGT